MAASMESTISLDGCKKSKEEWIQQQKVLFSKQTKTEPKFYFTYMNDGFIKNRVTMLLSDSPALGSLIVSAPADDLPSAIHWVIENNPHLKFEDNPMIYEHPGDVVAGRKSAKMDFIQADFIPSVHLN